MATVKLPSVSQGMSPDQLADVVARLIKEVQYLVDGNLDSKNAREFGGYQVGLTSFASKNGVVGLSSEVTAGDDIRIWAGDQLSGTPPFRVYESGKLVASNAEITGKVTASSGAIGGWLIGANYLTDAAGVVGMSSAVTGSNDIRFWAGNGTPGSAPFQVYEDGTMYATNGHFTGDITSSTVTSSTITGSLVRTAASGQRVEISSGDNLFTAYFDASNYIRIDPSLFTGELAFVSGSTVTSMTYIPFAGFTLDSNAPLTLQTTEGINVFMGAGKTMTFADFDRIYSTNDTKNLQQALDALQANINTLSSSKADAFSGFTGTLQMVTSVDFGTSIYYYYTLHYTNGVLTSVT